MDIAETTAAFTNFGSCLDLFAPGVDIMSFWMAGTEPLFQSGSSQAAAYVAGEIARIQSSAELARGPIEVSYVPSLTRRLIIIETFICNEMT